MNTLISFSICALREVFMYYLFEFYLMLEDLIVYIWIIAFYTFWQNLFFFTAFYNRENPIHSSYCTSHALLFFFIYLLRFFYVLILLLSILFRPLEYLIKDILWFIFFKGVWYLFLFSISHDQRNWNPSGYSGCNGFVMHIFEASSNFYLLCRMLCDLINLPQFFCSFFG